MQNCSSSVFVAVTRHQRIARTLFDTATRMFALGTQKANSLNLFDAQATESSKLKRAIRIAPAKRLRRFGHSSGVPMSTTITESDVSALFEDAGSCRASGCNTALRVQCKI